VRATLVKMVFASIEYMALALVSMFVPGRDPEESRLGVDGVERPSGPGFIQQMSSPTVRPSNQEEWAQHREVVLRTRSERARHVTRLTRGLVSFKMSMCSASQPSSRPSTEAMRNAKHFFPSRALPP